MAFAVNVIGKYILPPDWTNDPMTAECTQAADDDRLEFRTPHREPRQLPESQAFCEGTQFCHTPICDLQGGQNDFELVVDLEEPLDSLDQMQVAASGSSEWGNPSPMLTCSEELCTANPELTQITYHNTLNGDETVNYAVNIIGRFVMPPGDWTLEPYEYVCGDDTGTTLPPPTTPPGPGGGTGTRFVLELDEPNDSLPDQTRKYVLYFSEEMTYSQEGEGLTFAPTAGGDFTGILQMAYAGSTPRGDLSSAEYFDEYAGVYSYEPISSFCVMDDKVYVDFNWNKHDLNGPTDNGDLLMVAMPHHVRKYVCKTDI